METRTLGRTGLQVSRLGFGALELRGMRVWGGRPVTDQQADRILNAVLDAGINIIDTSPDYGLSEEYIGRFISHRRSEYYIATKAGCKLTRADGYDQVSHIWTRDRILRNIEESLARMKTDYVDVLQLHNPNPADVIKNKTIDTLHEVQEAGLTKFIGVSTTLPYLPDFLKIEVFDTFQAPYSALQRAHEEWISRISEAGAGTIIRGGIARGSVAEGGIVGRQPTTWLDAGLDEVRGDIGTMEFLLRFTLSHPHIDTVIVGTLSPEHLVNNIKAAEHGPLSASMYTKAKKRLSAVGEVPAVPFIHTSRA